MRVKLEYGKTGVEAEVPDRNLVGVLGLQPTPRLPDPQAAVREALRRPIGCPPLHELARRRKDACVVVCDVTRPVSNPVLLPPLLAALEGAGIPRERITLLVATGIHRPNEGAELEGMLGRETAARYPVVNHFARDLGSHRYLGRSRTGAPIYVDSRYCDADLKVVTGLVEPHLFAGYSGGRKGVCPGITALETVETFHSTRLLDDPAAQAGVVEGNPIHEMALEVARAAGVDFSLNVTFDEERRVTGVFAGALEAAWEAGVAQAREMATAWIDRPVDIVVTSNAGHPLDATFYQSVKGMTGALPILKPGGTVILASAMGEGIGSPEFARLLLESDDLDGLMARIRDPQRFVVDQWGVAALGKVLSRASVMVCAQGLDADTLRRLYVTPVASVEEGMARALAHHGADARVAVIRNGPYVMPRVHCQPAGEQFEVQGSRFKVQGCGRRQRRGRQP